MSERGLPIVDGAPACPFVAFEDDRDGRALAPDHRHRCFAEPRPATRALAHQEAYCLSSAFPVCPTFQDWARREAAAARPAPSGERQPRPEAPVSQPLPPRDLEPRHPPETEPQDPDTPRRNPPRDWAAPPPWTGDEDAGVPPMAAPPPFLAKSEPDRYGDQWGSDGRGLAGSRADQLAGPDPDVPVPSRRPAPAVDDLDDAWAGAGVAAVAAAGTTAPRPPSPGKPARYEAQRPGASSAGAGADGRPPAARPPQADPGRVRGRDSRPAQDPAELFGPAWEKPRRYEAYPSLRTRIGLPGLGAIPRIGIAAIALLLAAVVLFFVGPMLLGIGGKDQGSAVKGTPAPTEQVTDSPEPTLAPAPTPSVYIVAKGDTMSKIAKKNGVTVEALLAANPAIKNPNKIKIGDQIIIPVPVTDSTSSGEPVGSASP